VDRRLRALGGSLVAVIVATSVVGAVVRFGGAAASGERVRWAPATPKIGLSFEPNIGQAPQGIRFVAQTPNSWFGFSARSVTLGHPSPQDPAPRLTFFGARQDVSPIGRHRLPGVTNYLMGDDPLAWQTNVPRFDRIDYLDIYRGIDLSFYGSSASQLEFDLVVEPGVDPAAIRLGVAGAIPALGPDGDLRIASDRPIRLSRPQAFQTIDGIRRAVAVAFALDGRKVNFNLGSYDARFALVIDPVVEYSTYLGGSGREDVIYTAQGSDGSFYLTGATDSTDFPVTRGGLQNDLAGVADAFVTKLDSTGTEIVYSTYLGGRKLDVAIGIDVDGEGAAYVVGFTASRRFPTTPGAVQRRIGGGPADAFVTKLDPSGSEIVYSTFLGGDGDDVAFIAPVDADGSLYVEGWTGSKNFPTTDGAFQERYGGGPYDAFSTKLDASGSSLVYSTFVGGSGDDGGWDGDLDTAGRIHLTGGTDSRDFPVTPGAYQPRYGGGRTDAFVLVLDESGTDLVSSTYVGGKRYEEVTDLTVDEQANTYVPGTTTSKDFPTTPLALQTESAGGKHDGYLVQLNLEGTTLVYGTYIGGTGDDVTGAVRVSHDGIAVMSGVTTSPDFPVTPDAMQATFAGGPDDAFAMWLELNTSTVSYATYLGGAKSDGSSGAGLALDDSGTVTIPGYTNSRDFPTTPGVVQRRFGGMSDVFVVRMSP
jgi:hypothetical protein